jgi:hypothetical protein
MADYLMSLKCGDKTYYLSGSGKDVYFSSSSKTGGTTLKGVKLYNNELRLTSTNKPASEAQLAIQIQKSLSGGGCYISTAICTALGKDDDCPELSTLRRFRDEIMGARPAWAALVERYYREAPVIAERLAQQPELCRSLYEDHLVACLALIGAKRHDEAVERYAAMTRYCQSLN